LGSNPVRADTETFEDAGADALLFAQHTEEEMLGADVVVLQGTSLVLREDDDLPSSLREALEHGA
jgi:hypothetical protein